MNEQIQKLLDVARGKVYMDTLGAAVDNKLWDEMVHEKFAELIVEECAMVAYRKGFCQKCKGGQYISSDIRNHFRS